jgi:hypothetical protein
MPKDQEPDFYALDKHSPLPGLEDAPVPGLAAALRAKHEHHQRKQLEHTQPVGGPFGAPFRPTYNGTGAPAPYNEPFGNNVVTPSQPSPNSAWNQPQGVVPSDEPLASGMGSNSGATYPVKPLAHHPGTSSNMYDAGRRASLVSYNSYDASAASGQALFQQQQQQLADSRRSSLGMASTSSRHSMTYQTGSPVPTMIPIPSHQYQDSNSMYPSPSIYNTQPNGHNQLYPSMGAAPQMPPASQYRNESMPQPGFPDDYNYPLAPQLRPPDFCLSSQSERGTSSTNSYYNNQMPPQQLYQGSYAAPQRRSTMDLLGQQQQPMMNMPPRGMEFHHQ